ncbi:QueT transporter family protein [Dethiothermospora halolimnae]|uniref:QueT transporter family protein n=1 Tax=Dethiothermospora halolimnae TaxID=3114390 RepID=UPI003CCB9BBA
MDVKYLAKAGMIAAIYVILVLLQVPIPWLASGPFQIRIAEGLVLLPRVEKAAIPGVFVGCLLANFILSFVLNFGLLDIVGGSLVTLVSAYLTRKISNKFLSVLPPILLNGFIVSAWVSYFAEWPYWFTVLGITLGEAVSVILLGNIVLYGYKRIGKK